MMSIYCSETVDGFCAAAIMMRHAMLSKLPVHFGGFLHPDNLEEELIEMLKLDRQLICMLDVSISPSALEIFDKLGEKSKVVYWNTSDVKSVMPKIKLYDRGENKSSAELARDRFLPQDPVAKRLAQVAHEVKFWQLHDELSYKLSDVIAAQCDPILLLDLLSKGVFWNQQLEEFHKDYVQKKTAALDELMRSVKIKQYLNYRFGFAQASQVLTTADACNRMLEGHAGIDVAVALYRTGKIAFRRRENCDVDVKVVAELFGGGGREFAAGAKLSMQVTKDSIDDVLFYLDQAFKNFFLTTRL